MDQSDNKIQNDAPVKRPKNELSPQEIAERENAARLVRERMAAQAARVEEIRKKTESRKAAEFAKAIEDAEAKKREAARLAEEESPLPRR